MQVAGEEVWATYLETLGRGGFATICYRPPIRRCDPQRRLAVPLAAMLVGLSSRPVRQRAPPTASASRLAWPLRVSKNGPAARPACTGSHQSADGALHSSGQGRTGPNQMVERAAWFDRAQNATWCEPPSFRFEMGAAAVEQRTSPSAVASFAWCPRRGRLVRVSADARRIVAVRVNLDGLVEVSRAP